MAFRPNTLRKFTALLIGAMIGMFLGYIADQSLTHYIMQHSEDIQKIIITNALSAFLLLPMFIILGAFIGYRLRK